MERQILGGKVRVGRREAPLLLLFWSYSWPSLPILLPPPPSLLRNNICISVSRGTAARAEEGRDEAGGAVRRGGRRPLGLVMGNESS